MLNCHLLYHRRSLLQSPIRKKLQKSQSLKSQQSTSSPLVILFIPLPSRLIQVKPGFAFQSNSGFAGSPISFQLTFHSQSRKSIPKITFSSARLSFNEQIPEIVIIHVEGETTSLQKMTANSVNGTADLSIQPGETKTIEMSYTPIAQAQIEVCLP